MTRVVKILPYEKMVDGYRVKEVEDLLDEYKHTMQPMIARHYECTAKYLKW